MSNNEFEQRLNQILDTLSPENQTILIVRLFIFLKLNLVDYYENCKDCIGDANGKFLMEHLSNDQKKYLGDLELMAPELPDELEKEYLELSQLMVPLDIVEIPGISLLSSKPDDPDDDSVFSKVTDKDGETRLGLNGQEQDDRFLTRSINQKGWEMKMIHKLSSCIRDNSCSEVFQQILDEEKQNEELLVYNYNFLQNTGKWFGPGANSGISSG